MSEIISHRIVADRSVNSPTMTKYHELSTDMKFMRSQAISNVESFNIPDDKILMESIRAQDASYVVAVEPNASSPFQNYEYDAIAEISYSKSAHNLKIRVASNERKHAESLLNELVSYVTLRTISRDTIDVGFWVMAKHGPRYRPRNLKVPTWDEIHNNYTEDVQDEIERTKTMIHNPDAGRIIVWHGPPGVGKSYAIRAMMDHLREDCKFHYIIDPEVFFGISPDYMIDVVTTDIDDDDDDDFIFDEDSGEMMRGSKPKAKKGFFILEDTGELLQADAKERSGQGLSRLLNLADGIIGQGLDLRILLTTNESISSLHPAVTRDGRALSVLEFKPLSTSHANAWLNERNVDARVSEPTTIAELYAIVGEYQQGGRKEEDYAVGQYV